MKAILKFNIVVILVVGLISAVYAQGEQLPKSQVIAHSEWRY